jgi:hypothetical protein
MHNYRGFSDALIPLSQINFLVGENSTGKSSFMKLLYLLSNPQFWFFPNLSIDEEVELGGFADIVSAWAKDKSYFQVGVVTTTQNKEKEVEIRAGVHTFADRDGTPQLSHHIQIRDKQLTTIVFERKRTKYRTAPISPSFGSDAEALAYFRQVLAIERSANTGFTFFPRDLPPDPPLAVATSVIRNLERGGKPARQELHAEVPFMLDLTWIAPIRTRPRRFYDALSVAYSPQGDHTPLLLRRSLRARSKSSRFAQKLANFGRASGLFETVLTHGFGRNPLAPFEILIKFSNVDLNINNVGYGISQALPLVVEFLAKERKGGFAVQQPEVHLHPKAQAALGELIFELAKEREHSFYLETHSDYLIDRFRLAMHKAKNPPRAQVIFFRRIPEGNRAEVVPVLENGRYADEQPAEFREFFVKEELRLLDL